MRIIYSAIYMFYIFIWLRSSSPIFNKQTKKKPEKNDAIVSFFVLSLQNQIRIAKK